MTDQPPTGPLPRLDQPTTALAAETELPPTLDELEARVLGRIRQRTAAATAPLAQAEWDRSVLLHNYDQLRRALEIERNRTASAEQLLADRQTPDAEP
jgi:hypothetical protein